MVHSREVEYGVITNTMQQTNLCTLFQVRNLLFDDIKIFLLVNLFNFTTLAPSYIVLYFGFGFL